MKRLLILSVCLAAVLCRPAGAQDDPLLGRYHVEFQFDALLLQHDTFETDDAGLRVLMKAYRHVGDDWYVGVEASGGGSTLFFFAPTISMWTLEANAKHAFRLTRHLSLDLGGGISYTDAEITDFNWFLLWDEPDVRVSDSVLGVQALANLNLRLDWVLLGLSLKQTVTQDVEGMERIHPSIPGWDMSNFAIGLQAGFLLP